MPEWDFRPGPRRLNLPWAEAASGQRSRTRSSTTDPEAKARARQEIILTVQPMRIRSAVSELAGPSISSRSAPMTRRCASRQRLARAGAEPRPITVSKASALVMTRPPSSLEPVHTVAICSASSTCPISASPVSVASRRTYMFSAGSRSRTSSSRPAASEKRDSRCVGNSAISCARSARQRASSARRPFEALSSARAMVSRGPGRTSRIRFCMSQPSNMREGADDRTAARFERVLTASSGSVTTAQLTQ